jgi:hypothetical protein
VSSALRSFSRKRHYGEKKEKVTSTTKTHLQKLSTIYRGRSPHGPQYLNWFPHPLVVIKHISCNLQLTHRFPDDEFAKASAKASITFSPTVEMDEVILLVVVLLIRYSVLVDQSVF